MSGTILKNKSINDFEGLSGPAEANAMSYARGTATLSGGTQTVTIAGNANAQPFVSYAGGALSNPGRLQAGYDGTTLTITSDNAMDGSAVNWLILD